jgi:hypothetical protein
VPSWSSAGPFSLLVSWKRFERWLKSADETECVARNMSSSASDG